MANQVEKLNGIAITSIEKINGATDSNIEKINGLEFTGIVLVNQQSRSFTTVDSGGSAIGDAGEFDTGRAAGVSVAYDPDTSTLIYVYRDTGNSNRCTGRVATVSGDEDSGFTLTFGSEIEIDDSGTCYHTAAFYNTGQDRLMVAYMTSSGNNGQFAKAMTVRGGTTRDLTTLGNHLSVESGGSGYNQNCQSNIASLNQAANSGNGILHVCYEYGDDSNDGNYIRAVRISDTSDNTTVVGDRAEFLDDSDEFWGITYDETAQKNVVVYDDGTNISARTVEHGGTNDMTTSYGTAAQYGEAASLTIAEYYGGPNSAYDPDQNKHHVIMDVSGTGYINYFSVSGSTVTWAATSKKQALSSGTVAGNETGGGVAYSHARDRIITYGSTSSGTGANATFESHSFDGTDYTSVGSAVTYESRSGRPRAANVVRTDASALIGNSVVLAHYIYGGSADGTTLTVGLDAGNSGS